MSRIPAVKMKHGGEKFDESVDSMVCFLKSE